MDATQGFDICSGSRDVIFRPLVRFNKADIHAKIRSENGSAIISEAEDLLLLCAKDAAGYDVEASRLKSQLMYIEAQKKNLQDYTRKIRFLLSPIRRIPNEILIRIFEFACDTNWFTQKPSLYPQLDDQKSQLPALTVSAVCSRWRSLSTSSPRLWNSLYLEILTPYKNVEEGKRFQLALELYLERSACAPLYLDIDLNIQQYILFDTLVQHAHRWKTLQYRGDSRLLRNREFILPILEELDLSSHNMGIEDLNCFQNAPNLRILRTRSVPRSTRPLLALKQLESLTLRSLGVGAKLDSMLDLCDNLTVLELRYASVNYLAQLSATPRAVSSTVCTLNLFTFNENFLEAVLTTHTLPALTRLKLDLSSSEFIWPKYAFDNFLSRSTCVITSLSIDFAGLLEWDVVPALQSLHSLVDLSLKEYNADSIATTTSHLLSRLHAAGHTLGECQTQNDEWSRLLCPQVLVPKLRRLQMEMWDSRFYDNLVVSMVSSRWLPDPDYAAMIGVDCLESVALHFHKRRVAREVYEPLRHLDRMGLRVVVTVDGRVTELD
ncbi:hypothetical protein F5051DRAFT_58852 [Lentinula edodes]|nr:hypothetical protein F5051DRAFT_58852 [Lentinula edodes]